MSLEPSSSRIAVVGTGVIGASWAAYFLAKGFDVAATDPADGAEKRFTGTRRRVLAGAGEHGPRRGRLAEPAAL